MSGTIGIWGLGRVGLAAVNFFTKRGYTVGVMNDKAPTPQQHALLSEHNIRFFDQTHEQELFFTQYSYILPSPGIDLRPYQQHASQFITEVDVFSTFFHRSIIAITGSLGKTSTTYLLTQALNHSGLRAAMGGNVGVPMFELIDQQEALDYAVLELSSFQLEYACSFAPDLAIITNIYPNHLDRHGTFAEYRRAKLPIFMHQKEGQQTLLPWDLYQQLVKDNCPLPRTYALMHTSAVPDTSVTCYYPQDTQVWKNVAGTAHPIATITALKHITFSANATLVTAALDMLGHTLTDHRTYTLPEHRVEYVATINKVMFFNDSKSTLPQATQAALERLVHLYPEGKGRIILFIGGLDKGVDRTPLIAFIAQSKLVKTVIAFGAQASSLTAACTSYSQSCIKTPTLEEAFTVCTQYAQENDIVLFSPSGTSYDLFTHYEQRGHTFKQLVQHYAQHAQ